MGTFQFVRNNWTDDWRRPWTIFWNEFQRSCNAPCRAALRSELWKRNWLTVAIADRRGTMQRRRQSSRYCIQSKVRGTCQ
jgi:hypothetical protein